MEYSDKEKRHANVLERLAKTCRCNREGFTDTTKIDEIRKELNEYGSLYQETLGKTYSLWGKRSLSEIPDNEKIIVVSSHADIVPYIRHPFSRLEDSGNYVGTFDNLGTNTAAVLLMEEENLPDNVFFAFTSGEEDCKCEGVRDVVAKIRESGHDLYGVALDVTYEGFGESNLFTLENLTGSEFLQLAGDSVMDMEPEKEKTFTFVKKNKHSIPEAISENYMSKSTGMYDEAFAYVKNNVEACSFCLPSKGSMHSDKGLTVRQPVYEGYLLSLTSFLYEITRTKDANKQLIDAYKIIRSGLVEKAKEIMEAEQKVWYPVEEHEEWKQMSIFSYQGFEEKNNTVSLDNKGSFDPYAPIEDEEDYTMEMELWQSLDKYDPSNEALFIQDSMFNYGFEEDPQTRAYLSNLFRDYFDIMEENSRESDDYMHTDKTVDSFDAYKEEPVALANSESESYLER